MRSGRERQHAQWLQRSLATWQFRNERRLLPALRCGIQMLLCRDGAVQWREEMPQSVRRQSRIVIRSFWPSGVEWRPLGSSAHTFCMTPWMPKAIFRCWKITCPLTSNQPCMYVYIYVCVCVRACVESKVCWTKQRVMVVFKNILVVPETTYIFGFNLCNRRIKEFMLAWT